MRSFVRAALEEEDGGEPIEVVEASSGFEALRLLPRGPYDCVVTDSSGAGSVRSDPAGLSVVPSCGADFNRDGSADSQDFFDFLVAFFTGCP